MLTDSIQTENAFGPGFLFFLSLYFNTNDDAGAVVKMSTRTVCCMKCKAHFTQGESYRHIHGLVLRYVSNRRKFTHPEALKHTNRDYTEKSKDLEDHNKRELEFLVSFDSSQQSELSHKYSRH